MMIVRRAILLFGIEEGRLEYLLHIYAFDNSPDFLPRYKRMEHADLMAAFSGTRTGHVSVSDFDRRKPGDFQKVSREGSIQLPRSRSGTWLLKSAISQ